MAELLCGKEGASADGERHANLFEITGIAVSACELIPAFKKGFEETFSVALESGQLLDLEWSKANAIKDRESLPV